MRRGDVVVVAGPGDFGKPRPAIIIQSDRLTDAGLGSVIVALMKSKISTPAAFRVPVKPDASNGLRRSSSIMVDKLQTVRRERIGQVIGRLNDETLLQLNRTLAFVTGLAD